MRGAVPTRIPVCPQICGSPGKKMNVALAVVYINLIALLYWKWESNSTTVYYYHVTSPPFLHPLPQPNLRHIPPVLQGCPGQDGHQLQNCCPPLPQGSHGLPPRLGVCVPLHV